MFDVIIEIYFLSLSFILMKFPKEFLSTDEKEIDIVNSLADMIGDELVRKNENLFIKPYINQFANIEDINIGDKDEFYVNE